MDDEFAKKVSQTNSLQELKDLIMANLHEEKKEKRRSLKGIVSQKNCLSLWKAISPAECSSAK